MRMTKNGNVAWQKSPLGLPVDHEIVVADDASDDATGEIAQAFGAQVVREHHRQIAATRNAGARTATGNLLIFVDADTLVTEELVRETYEAFQAGAVGGGARVKFDGRLPFWARVMLIPLVRLYILFKLAPGCFLFCTREAFESTGGFNEQMFAGEETDMTLRLHKLGRFVITKSHVITSARKVRDHSAGEIAGVLFRSLIRGRKGVAKREGLELWYAPRRCE